MKKFQNVTKVMLALMLTSSMLVSCGSSSTNVDETTDVTTDTDTEVTTLTIATTTSLYNTGLLDELETDFEAKYPYDVEYIVVGSGAAIQSARDGECDGLFVHSEDAENQLVEDGVSLGRNPLMYDYFEIVGPAPLEATDLDGVLDEIRDNDLPFVSRGDQSGTHVKELAMWDGNLPSNYTETGKGMADTLMVANELQAYTLTDDGTFEKNQDNLDLEPVYQNDEFFKNTYSYHVINPNMNDYINYQGSQDFLAYLQSPETLDLISSFGADEFGEPFYTLVD